jgi:hypothetical protein
LRRWIGVAVFLTALGIAVLVIPRLGARSPLVIVFLCVVAVLTMKLVERQVHRWFQVWAKRQARRTVPPKTGS